MLVIRLSRGGKKKQPTYRVVVQEKQRDPWGTSIEIVGNYNPRTSPSTLNLKEDRIQHWLEKGAQPSATVHNLLVGAGLIKGDKVRATTHDKKEPVPAEEKPAEAPKAEEAEASSAATAEEEPKEEAPAAEEKPAEEPKAEEPKEEAPAEDEKKEEAAA
jgi:small subunit ribosomal protein S16